MLIFSYFDKGVLKNETSSFLIAWREVNESKHTDWNYEN